MFDVPEDIAYFNTANMSPLLRCVREAGETGLARRAAPWAINAEDWFSDVERLRGLFAGLLGTSDEGISLVPATSYGLAVTAGSLTASRGDQVVVLAGEYPSNFYTWRRFCERTEAELMVVDREEGADWTASVIGRLSERTRIVAIPNVHWTNGAILDLGAIANAARSARAALVIDASQSLGALPLDASELKPDFVVAVGYKWLLGPFGLGCLYVAEQYRDRNPLEENWINRAGSENFAALADYTDEYRTGARRFDVGQRTSFGLVPMAVAAIEQLLEWGVDNVASSLRVVTDEIGQRAAQLGLNVPDRAQHGPHMLGIEVPREVALRLGAALAERGVIASVRGNSLRIAPHLHVTSHDIDCLVDSLGAAL
ncbi:MAG: aminotransferase class V-fold PLP-dependent enzyme [Acidimicrobiales bacterium]